MPEITFDEFKKLELKTGIVRFAEKVEGADKLLRLLVDVGEAEDRQVVAGIAQQFDPESPVGQQIVVVATPAPGRSGTRSRRRQRPRQVVARESRAWRWVRGGTLAPWPYPSWREDPKSGAEWDVPWGNSIGHPVGSHCSGCGPNRDTAPHSSR